jgi:hypothetical protein
MSFQDVETGLSRSGQPSGITPQSREDSAFLSLQSSLSLQVFKINSNVQGILKLVDQLGTTTRLCLPPQISVRYALETPSSHTD